MSNHLTGEGELCSTHKYSQIAKPSHIRSRASPPCPNQSQDDRLSDTSRCARRSVPRYPRVDTGARPDKTFSAKRASTSPA